MTVVWLGTFAAAVAASVPWVPLDVRHWIAGLGAAVFVVAEAYALRSGEPTKSEFVWDRVPHPIVRWALGVWLGALVMRFVHPWLGLGVALWLPLHWAVRGIEKRILQGR